MVYVPVVQASGDPGVLSVKNTFLHVSKVACEGTPRSSSVPRSWRLDSASTAAGDDTPAISSHGSTYSQSETGSSSGLDVPLRGAFVPETLVEDIQDHPVDTFICPTAICEAEPRIVPRTFPFEVLAGPAWTQVRGMVSAVHQALETEYEAEVSVSWGPMGGATGIVATIKGGPEQADHAKEVAKATLLEAAAHSESVYVMGYLAKPFRDFGETGFKCWVGNLHHAKSGCVCWDTFQKGFCPRRTTCRWYHLDVPDLMRVIVQIHRVP